MKVQAHDPAKCETCQRQRDELWREWLTLAGLGLTLAVGVAVAMLARGG
jgi:hypothetical protein